MKHISKSAVATLLSAATQVAAHGHVQNIVINGVSYAGWDINVGPYQTNPDPVVAWQTPNTSNGFITPDDADTADIICHLNATNARGHATVAAGDKIYLQWTPAWPDSHHGPVIDYLANCNGPCETVDKTTLKFFKIDGVGLVDDTTPPGTWGDDQLIANGNGWLVEIPPTIAPGNYVLRHEMIALHGAGSDNGAQLYPQCFNLAITGSGTAAPAGTLAEQLYSPTDPGILINIYQSLSTYIVPGPTIIAGAVSLVQSSSAITASGTPTTGTGAATTSAATTTTSAASTTTTTTKSTTTTVVTTSAPTTTTTKTTTTGATTTTSGSTATQTVYGQCGGSGWTGPTACASGSTCTYSNDWYSQCIPS